MTARRVTGINFESFLGENLFENVALNFQPFDRENLAVTSLNLSPLELGSKKSRILMGGDIAPLSLGLTPVNNHFALSEKDNLELELKARFLQIRKQNDLETKVLTIGIKWDAIEKKYLKSLKGVKKLSDFELLYAALLTELKDAHVSTSLQSTLTYSLPMQFSHVQKKIIVGDIADDFAKKLVPPPAVGDELLEINGMPWARFKEQYPIFNKYGNDLTDTSLFAWLLTRVSQARGFNLTNDEADKTAYPKTLKLKLISNTIKAPYEVTVDYKITGDGYVDRPILEDKVDVAPGRLHKSATLWRSLSLKNPEEEVSPYSESFANFMATAPSLLSSSANLAHFDILNQHLLAQNETPMDPTVLKKIDTVEKLFADVHQLFKTEAAIPLEVVANNKLVEKNSSKTLMLAEREPIYKLPPDFKEIKPEGMLSFLLNPDDFFAGYFWHKGKRVGLLRIPDYMPSKSYTLLHSLRYYIGMLNKNCDYLIVDQTYNPGGTVLFSDLLIKSLMGDYNDEKHMLFKVKPTDNFMAMYKNLLTSLRTMPDSMFKDPQKKQQLLVRIEQDYLTILKAHETQSLSEPVSLRPMSELFELIFDGLLGKYSKWGRLLSEKMFKIDVFKPQVFKKPVYFFTNEFDFSGGDATAAVLQDYGVPIFGVRTAGAGGTVNTYRMDMGIPGVCTLRTSAMYRPKPFFGQHYVENYGVIPNHPFELTVDDYINNFDKTFTRMLETVDAVRHPKGVSSRKNKTRRK